MRTTNPVRSKINKRIAQVVKPVYFEEIPLEDLFVACEAEELQPVDEEGSRWTGFLCGAQGTAMFELCDMATRELINNARLVVQWYKMQSGRYEIVSYVG